MPLRNSHFSTSRYVRYSSMSNSIFWYYYWKRFFFGNAAIKGYTGPCIPMVTNIVMITRFNTCPSFPITFHTKKSKLFIFFLGCYNGWHDDSSSDRSIFSFRGCLQYKPSTKIVFWGAWHLRQWYVYKANLFWLHRREEGQSSKAKSWGKTKLIKC